ncbi:MAG: murein hydrolase activator EnvC family protein, partial [Rhodothalassiaceae bacterium]
RFGARPATATQPPATTPFAAARGSLPLPVRGALVKEFGEQSGALHERGITIAALPGAQVVAPYDGRVVFAGPFRGYGQLLIISHGGGYHTLLAGMARIYATVGQWVLAGEPVGEMAAGDARAAVVAGGAGATAGTTPKLYVELRQGGEPVDPLPWLAAGLRKVG